MLPSFRLIVATFLCGFVAVFAGLRIVTALHDANGALPLMAAHAASAPITTIADKTFIGGRATVPVLYDLRFVASAAALAPIPARVTPHAFDLSALPVPQDTPEEFGEEPAIAPSVSEAAITPPKVSVAAIKPEAPAKEIEAIAAAPAELPNAEQKTEQKPPAVAAIEPQAPHSSATAAEPQAAPTPEISAAVEPPTAPAPTPSVAAVEPASAPEARKDEPPAKSEPDATDTGPDTMAAIATEGAAPAIAETAPIPKSRPEIKPEIKSAQAKPKPVKRRRAVRRKAAQDPFGFTFNN